MTILKVVWGEDYGGVLTCEEQFIKYLRARKVNVKALIIGQGPAVDRYVKISDECIHVSTDIPAFSGGMATKLYRAVQNEIVSSSSLGTVRGQLGDVDVVSVTRPRYLSVSGDLGRTTESPVLWHIPDSINSIPAKVYYRTLCCFKGILPLANSKYTRQSLGNPSVPVVYPGFSSSRVSGTPTVDLRDELGISDNSPIFGNLSRIHHDKAQDLLIKGFIDSEAISRGAHLVISGGPTNTEFYSYVNNLASRYTSSIHFTGHIENVSNFYSFIDVVVNSRRNVEPFGISVVEAMFASKPVLAYERGGPKEILRDGQTGWLLSDSSASSFASGFDRAIDDRCKWQEMGESAHHDSLEYRVEKQAEKYLSIANLLT
ncbi:glycosyltransferase family 4 protein [Salinibacter ruber]|uniref:Glycosyltransferase involved in cell wall biosynthesis n=1 Tax=Salinibacter ruber TaxID=146919 RepID=A0A9X2Q3L6_9BACT|nr:glycosyltransferase family 4 protein [Salinibacter ruber]MCS3661158.1 glycosyltransferase involved in cell wall biosynthesis [Salinibacter ruber]MCS3710957.1 glycosyltransferase involved in cell wall biosynthesis [Salinibacter ruber]